MSKEGNSKRLGVALQKIYKEAATARQETSKKWEDYLKWFKGEQKVPSRSDSQANTVTNFLFSQIWTMVPILTNRLPEVVLKPVVSGDRAWKAYADFLSDEINRIFHRNSFYMTQQELVLNGLVFGISYLKPTWDADMLNGKGGIKISVPDTRRVFLEPGKGIKGANYVLERSAVDRLSLYRSYPDRKDTIDRLFFNSSGVNEGAYYSEIPAPNTSGHQIGDGTEDTDTRSYVWDVAMSKGGLKDKLDLVEGWFYDDELIKVIVEVEESKRDGAGKEIIKKVKKEVEKRKYPNGRLITFVGNEIFVDMPNKFPDYPYIPYYNYYIPGMNYSMSELEQLMDLQEQYNMRQNQITDIITHNIGRKLFFGANSGVDKDNFTNRPIECHDCTDPSQIKALDAPSMPGQLFDSQFLIKQNIETVSGVKEVTQGSVPGDVRSGAAIDALQEAAQVRLQMKSHAIENTIVDLSRFLVKMIANQYEYKVHYKPYIDITTGEKFELTDLGKVDPSDFDFEVKAGANLPSSRYAQQELLKWMYSEGIVDEKYIVEQMQIEGKESLIARMNEQWEARKQAELGPPPVA